jgi:prephenate dehydrogenase
MRLDQATVAIVGLGLMGGSLAAALRSHENAEVGPASIIGVARRASSIETALARGWIDWGTSDPLHAVQRADVVVLATPVRTAVALLRELGPHLRTGCVVTDLCSTKAEIVRVMADLPPSVCPIGGHPMCGKEMAGLDAAEADLFQGKVYVLTPLERTPFDAITFMQQIVGVVGARALILDPVRHDRLVAVVSHLPYLLAASLVNTADAVGADDALVWELAASGFRDTSRLAGSETQMMRDILMTNRESVRQMIHLFRDQLARFEECLSVGDEACLTGLMLNASQRRRGMFQ